MATEEDLGGIMCPGCDQPTGVECDWQMNYGPHICPHCKAEFEIFDIEEFWTGSDEVPVCKARLTGRTGTAHE
jgi:hypothetical protein